MNVLGFSGAQKDIVMTAKPYNSINDLLRERFGCKVYKVSLDSGLGCPNRDRGEGCIFCNMKAYEPLTPDRRQQIIPIKEQLKAGIEYIRTRHGAERVIAYFQSGSNTNAPAHELAHIYNDAISDDAVAGLAISTRPDCISEEHLDLIEKIARKTVLWVELGLQSSHDATLHRIGRGHTALDFANSCNALQRRGIPVCAHIILGLPLETRAMMLETAEFLNRVGVWGVKIHNLHVLRDTKLEELYDEGKVNIPSLEEYADLVVDFLEALDPKTVIHRFNSHSPRRLTVAPEWSVNKLAVFNAVESRLEERNSYQGKKFQ